VIRAAVSTALLTVVIVLVAAVAPAPPAQAAPRQETLLIYSPAMHKTIRVRVQRPADTARPHPTLYLLNGLDAGLTDLNWAGKTDVLRFLGTREVNVVQPLGGRGSYYTDWRSPDPYLGIDKWQTFLTEELPPIIDARLHTTGVNAIVGMSMSATSVLQLAIAKPGLYKSVASFSGCAQLSDPVGSAFASLVVLAGGGNPVNMYGPPGDPMWAANDPYLHADKLRGTNLYISSGSGLPGAHDSLRDPHADPLDLPGQIVVGGILETAVSWCTHNLRNRLAQLGIPATFDLTPTGTHSWGYWQDELHESWPVLAKGLELPLSGRR
jgi:S-formylglutathione hydrolase FrmB